MSKLSDFFRTGNQAPADRRMRKAEGDNPTQPSAPAGSTAPTQADFFYSSPEDLRKKKGTK